MKKEINTKNAPSAIGPYSQAISFNNLVFVSGQIPINPKDNTIPEGVEEQTKQVLNNLVEVLKEAGSNPCNVVKCNIFIKNMDDFATINSIYESYFTKPYPARAVVEVARLPKDVLVEIEAITFV